MLIRLRLELAQLLEMPGLKLLIGPQRLRQPPLIPLNLPPVDFLRPLPVVPNLFDPLPQFPLNLPDLRHHLLGDPGRLPPNPLDFLVVAFEGLFQLLDFELFFGEGLLELEEEGLGLGFRGLLEVGLLGF